MISTFTELYLSKWSIHCTGSFDRTVNLWIDFLYIRHLQYYRFPSLELFKLEARFVLRQGQHVNNMEENTNYHSLQCNSLGQILKILKVGKGCSNEGQPSTKCYEQSTLCRLSSSGSTFNPSRLTRSSHFLRALSTFGNWKKRLSLFLLLSDVQPTAIQCLTGIWRLRYCLRVVMVVPEISRDLYPFLLFYERVHYEP